MYAEGSWITACQLIHNDCWKLFTADSCLSMKMNPWLTCELSALLCADLALGSKIHLVAWSVCAGCVKKKRSLQAEG
jgi:hypothetical protein